MKAQKPVYPVRQHVHSFKVFWWSQIALIQSSKSITCRVPQGLLLFQGWRTGSSAGIQEPALWDTTSAHSNSERASPPATHIDAILQIWREKEMKTSCVYRNQSALSTGTWRSWGGEGKQVRTECAQVLPEAAPNTKMPSYSLKKELHHLCSYFMDKNTWKPITQAWCENTH